MDVINPEQVRDHTPAQFFFFTALNGIFFFLSFYMN